MSKIVDFQAYRARRDRERHYQLAHCVDWCLTFWTRRYGRGGFAGEAKARVQAALVMGMDLEDTQVY